MRDLAILATCLTLIAISVGCLLMGFLSQVARISGRFTNEGVLLLLVDALGALTTFSTFSKEAVDLFHVGIQVVFGLAVEGGGYKTGWVVQRWRA